MSEAETSDAILVSQSLNGDEAAFSMLAARNKKWLYQFITRYVRNEADAQDVLQESFIAAWRGLASYDPARPFGAWLRRVALNKCRDRARRNAVRRFLIPWADIHTASVPDTAQPVDEGMVENETLARVRQAIAALPDKLKSPLILTVLEGLSHAEAAEVLGTTPKSVEGSVYRARKRLSEMLQEQEDRSMPRIRHINSIVW